VEEWSLAGQPRNAPAAPAPRPGAAAPAAAPVEDDDMVPF
jgi:hypothetical protein